MNESAIETMKSQALSIFFKTAIIVVFSAIAACSTPVAKTPATNEAILFTAAETLVLERLKNDLPGIYTNFTQVVESGLSEDDTTDLTIRELAANDTPVFLFESHQRSSAHSHYDLYWLGHNPESKRLEMHFSRITGSELSAAEAETLNIGLRRAMPGCAIDLQLTDTQLKGQTVPESCLFENPVHGQSHIYRSIDLRSEQLDLVNLELKPGEVVSEELPTLQFQKRQVFEGDVSIGLNATTDEPESGQWQTSTKFIVIDDGRVSRLYDADMNNMEYAIKLSRLHWRKDEPTYLKLEVIQVDSGEAQAYSWFNPDSDQIKLDLDWVKVNLKKISLQNSQ